MSGRTYTCCCLSLQTHWCHMGNDPCHPSPRYSSARCTTRHSYQPIEPFSETQKEGLKGPTYRNLTPKRCARKWIILHDIWIGRISDEDKTPVRKRLKDLEKGDFADRECLVYCCEVFGPDIEGACSAHSSQLSALIVGDKRMTKGGTVCTDQAGTLSI